MAVLLVSMELSEQINIYFRSILLALEKKVVCSSLWNMYLSRWQRYPTATMTCTECCRNVTKDVCLVSNNRRHRPKFPWKLNKVIFWEPKTCMCNFFNAIAPCWHMDLVDKMYQESINMCVLFVHYPRVYFCVTSF